MAKGFNMDLGDMAHRLFDSWYHDGGYLAAQTDGEDEILKELVSRGIAIHVHGWDYCLAPEYQ